MDKVHLVIAVMALFHLLWFCCTAFSVSYGLVTGLGKFFFFSFFFMLGVSFPDLERKKLVGFVAAASPFYILALGVGRWL